MEKEPPIKKEKIKIKEPTKKYESKKSEANKKDEISSPKITVTIPTNTNGSSTTLKASPAAASVAPIPKIIIPTDKVRHDDETGSTSSSSCSDDQPIGAKRKAEVLSKESGKIGVTIKKTATSTITKPLISPKIKIDKKSSSSSSSTPSVPAPMILKVEDPQDSATESSSSSSSSSSLVITSSDKKEKEKSKQESSSTSSTKTTIKTSKLIPESNKILIKTETEPKTPEKSTESAEMKTKSSKENKYTNLMQNSNMKLLSSPKSAHPKLWLPKTQSSTDQVFITDVTVNLETVTIRECKTERGFFKSRHEETDRNSNFTKAQ
jgi:chromobox protein 8